MSFIAKNPISAVEITSLPPVPIKGTRGIFAKKDGWYDIDSSDNINKIATIKDINELLADKIDENTAIKVDANNNTVGGDQESNKINESGILNSLEGKNNSIGISMIPSIKGSIYETNTIIVNEYNGLYISPIRFDDFVYYNKIVNNNGVYTYTVYQASPKIITDNKGNYQNDSDDINYDNIVKIEFYNGDILFEFEFTDTEKYDFIISNGESFSFSKGEIILAPDTAMFTGMVDGVNFSYANGYQNTALSSSVHITGDSNIVGARAYQILESNKSESTYTLDSVIGLQTGDIYSIRLSANYDNWGKITDIYPETNTVKVDTFIDKAVTASSSFRIVSKPWLGTTNWASYARSSGVSNRVHGDAASADGRSNIITGRYGRASGYLNKTGYAGHVQNRSNTALGIDASGSGRDTVADGERSFTMGHGTVAKAKDQLARGKYNIPDNGQNYADIVGNGKDDNNRSNAYTLDWNGNGWFAGSITTEGDIIANDIKLPYLIKEITVDGETTIDRTLKKSSGSIIQNIKVDDIDVFNLSDKNIELSATKKYHDNLVIVNGKISVIKNIRKLTIDSRFGKYWKQATAKSSSGGRTFSKRFYIDINSLIDSEGNTLLTPEELEIFNKGEMVFFTDSGYSSHFSTYITKQPYTHDRFYLEQSSSKYIRLHIFDTNATNILVSANNESIYHEIGSIEIPEGEYDIRTESIDFYFGIVSPKTIDIRDVNTKEWKNLMNLYNYDSVVSANAISDFNDEVSEISLNTNVILDNFVDMIADLKTKNYTTDSEMSDVSTNPVQNKVIKEYVDNAVQDVEILLDTEMSNTSENPVQNKVVTYALGEKVDKEDGKGLSTNDFTDEYKKQLDDGINIDVDTKLSETSENPVQNKVITSALSYKIKRINYHVPLGIWQQEPGMFDFCMTRLPDGRIGFEQQDSMIVFYISQGNLVKGTKNTLILTQSTMNENTVGVQTIFDSNTNLLWQRMNLDSTKEWTEWEVISVSQTDLDKKVDKVDGKGLSTNDFTDVYKNTLENLENTVSTSLELKEAIANGVKNISLGDSFILDEKITLSNGMCLNGCGYTITRATGYEETLFSIKNGSTIRNIKIDGNRENMVNPRWETTREIVAWDKCIIEDVEIVNGNEAILLTNGYDSIVRNCRITDCGGNGIHFSGSHRARVENCTVINSNLKSGMGHEDGCIIWSNLCEDIVCLNNWCEGGISGFGSIDSEDNSNAKLIGNTVKNCTTAIDLRMHNNGDARNTIINSNHFISSGNIQITATGNTIPESVNCIISSNVLDDTGINIYSIADVNINGNTLNGKGAYIKTEFTSRVSLNNNRIDNTTSGGYGVYVAEGCKDIKITNNYIRAKGYGLYDVGRDTFVVGNTFRQNYEDGSGYFFNFYSSGLVFNDNNIAIYKDGIPPNMNNATIKGNKFYMVEDNKTAVYLTASKINHICAENRSNGQFALASSAENCIYENNNIPLPTIFDNLTAAFTNVTSVVPTKVIKGDKFTCTLIADDGYELPESITITNDGVNCVVNNDYTYDKKAGNVVIQCVMGAVTITATGRKRGAE